MDSESQEICNSTPQQKPQILRKYVPDYEKIFDNEEALHALTFFCKLYLRNLPLIRLLTLPNFGFELDTTIEPDYVAKKTKKSKKKKDKKGKKKDKKKK